MEKTVKIIKEKPKCCAGFWHLIAGLAMVIIGFFIWFNPALSLIALSLYLGTVLVVIGAGYISASLDVDIGWFTFVGVLDILIGIILVTNIGLTAASLPLILGIWCLAVGAAQLVSSYKFGRQNLPWGWSLALGILGLVFGFLILEYPVLGTVTISTLMGLYFVFYGLFEIGEYLYFRKN